MKFVVGWPYRVTGWRMTGVEIEFFTGAVRLLVTNAAGTVFRKRLVGLKTLNLRGAA
ncbi:MAG: hypothetical protein N3G20_08060 [Verrucomicrobiae bacterium]|nr:hypothetical protein [Verrucomicrobiae bacterium]